MKPLTISVVPLCAIQCACGQIIAMTTLRSTECACGIAYRLSAIHYDAAPPGEPIAGVAVTVEPLPITRPRVILPRLEFPKGL